MGNKGCYVIKTLLVVIFHSTKFKTSAKTSHLQTAKILEIVSDCVEIIEEKRINAASCKLFLLFPQCLNWRLCSKVLTFYGSISDFHSHRQKEDLLKHFRKRRTSW